MVNSNFDTIINNDYNNMNNKKSKFKVFIILFLILILLTGGVFGYFYYKQYQEKMPKVKFFEYVGVTNINKICDVSTLNAVIERMQTSSFDLQSDLKFNLDVTAENDENMDLLNERTLFILGKYNLPKINASFRYTKNEVGNKKAELTLNKETQKLITFSFLEDNEKIALKSDDIIIKYIGSKKEDLLELEEKIGSIYDNDSNVNIEEQENLLKVEIPDKNILNKYKNLIDEKITDDKFSIENINYTQNGQSIGATLYEMKLSKEEMLQTLTQIKEQFLNDKELINCFITGKNSNNISDNIIKLANGYKMDFSVDEIGKYIEKGFSNCYDYIFKLENFEFKIDIYVSDGKVIKKSICLGDNLEINIENEVKSEEENTYNFTIISKDEENKKNGISLSLNRINKNISTNIDVELNIIENMQINNKLTMKITLEGNENAANLTSRVSANFNNTAIKMGTTLDSTLKFKYEDEIETINSENCLLMDELSEEELSMVVEQIKNRTLEVLKQKIDVLTLDDSSNVSENEGDFAENLINMNPPEQERENENSSTSETEESEEQTQVTTITKEEAREKLIAAISEQMRVAESENREYIINDLSNLEIQDSVVSVMVGENMAVIAIDGYTFYIDPNFVLTEE